MDKETYLIKDLDDDEGLIHSHSEECVVSIFKYAAELLDIVLRARVEFGEFFEHGDVWGSPPKT